MFVWMYAWLPKRLKSMFNTFRKRPDFNSLWGKQYSFPNLHYFQMFIPLCVLSVCCCLAPNSKILAKLQDISFQYDFLCPILHVIHNRLLAMTFWLLKKVLKVATLGIGKMPKESEESIIILHTTLFESHIKFKF